MNRASPFSNSDERVINAFSITPVTDSNMVTWFLARIIAEEVAHQHGVTRSNYEQEMKRTPAPNAPPAASSHQQRQGGGYHQQPAMQQPTVMQQFAAQQKAAQSRPQQPPVYASAPAGYVPQQQMQPQQSHHFMQHQQSSYAAAPPQIQPQQFAGQQRPISAPQQMIALNRPPAGGYQQQHQPTQEELALERLNVLSQQYTTGIPQQVSSHDQLTRQRANLFRELMFYFARLAL
jgi:hypothetical protein